MAQPWDSGRQQSTIKCRLDARAEVGCPSHLYVSSMAMQGNQPPELVDREREQNRPSATQEEAVSDLLSHLDTHKSMGLDGIYLRVLRELAEMLTKFVSIIYQQSWLTVEVPNDWKLPNVMPIYKKG
ncbi:RNA-directed DNA polymerase from mobile element jockey [Turdus rufiventris]|nr:RNA-directed DNA polymerase from mobile element jockey [Turdus rufiventris]